MVVGSATGRATINEVAIFFLITIAALLHSVGRSLERRAPERSRLPLPGP
jgi:hypothetical protein